MILLEPFDPNLVDPQLVEMTRVRPGVGDGEEDQKLDSMLLDSKGDALLPSRGNLHNLKKFDFFFLFFLSWLFDFPLPWLVMGRKRISLER